MCSALLEKWARELTESSFDEAGLRTIGRTTKTNVKDYEGELHAVYLHENAPALNGDKMAPQSPA